MHQAQQQLAAACSPTPQAACRISYSCSQQSPGLPCWETFPAMTRYSCDPSPGCASNLQQHGMRLGRQPTSSFTQAEQVSELEVHLVTAECCSDDCNMRRQPSQHVMFKCSVSYYVFSCVAHRAFPWPCSTTAPTHQLLPLMLLAYAHACSCTRQPAGAAGPPAVVCLWHRCGWHKPVSKRHTATARMCQLFVLQLPRAQSA